MRKLKISSEGSALSKAGAKLEATAPIPRAGRAERLAQFPPMSLKRQSPFFY